MFNDRESIAKAREKLNAVSPSFCVAKWLNSTIHLHLGRTHSCHLPGHHAITLKDIKKDPSGIHNTGEKKEQRKMMMQGKRPSGCQSCWNIEDLPGDHFSDRHYMAHYFWARPHFGEVLEKGHKESINPRYLEISFSSSCNFKCSYCSPSYSSSWEKEVREYGPYMLMANPIYLEPKMLKFMNEMPIPEEGNPYIESFWKWWPNLREDLKVFRITGGEPLLSKDTLKVFEEIKKSPLPELEFSINTNLGIPEVTFNKYLDHVKEILDHGKVRRFVMYTSIDTFGEQAEYIRHGLDFNIFQERVVRYLETGPKAHLSFMCTFNALSVFHYEKFLEWVLELRQRFGQKRDIFVDIPYLRFPRFMNVQILPPSYHHYVEKLVRYMRANRKSESIPHGFNDGEVAKMERIYAWMIEPYKNDQGEVVEKKLTKHQKDFRRFFREHDKRRGTDLLKVFPELEDFWKSLSK